MAANRRQSWGTDASMMMRKPACWSVCTNDGGITRGADVNDIPEQPPLSTMEPGAEAQIWGKVRRGGRGRTVQLVLYGRGRRDPRPASRKLHGLLVRDRLHKDDMYVCVEGDEERRQSSEVKTFATNESV